MKRGRNIIIEVSCPLSLVFFLLIIIWVIAGSDRYFLYKSGSFLSIIFMSIIITMIAMLVNPRYSVLGSKRRMEDYVKLKMRRNPEDLTKKELERIINDIEIVLNTLESNYVNGKVSEKNYDELKKKYSERLELFRKYANESTSI